MKTTAARQKIALTLGRQHALKFFVEVSPGLPAMLCAAPTCFKSCRPGTYRITVKAPGHHDSEYILGLAGSAEY